MLTHFVCPIWRSKCRVDTYTTNRTYIPFVVSEFCLSTVRVLYVHTVRVLYSCLVRVLYSCLVRVLYSCIVRVLYSCIVRVLYSCLARVLYSCLARVLYSCFARVLYSCLARVLYVYIVRVLYVHILHCRLHKHVCLVIVTQNTSIQPTSSFSPQSKRRPQFIQSHITALYMVKYIYLLLVGDAWPETIVQLDGLSSAISLPQPGIAHNW